MKNLGYGKGIYAHDTKEKISAMQCLPDSLKDKEYYKPNTLGNEAKFKERLEAIKKWETEHKDK